MAHLCGHVLEADENFASKVSCREMKTLPENRGMHMVQKVDEPTCVNPATYHVFAFLSHEKLLTIYAPALCASFVRSHTARNCFYDETGNEKKLSV